MVNLHHRTCPLCEATCGLELEVTDGAVRRIRGDRDDVFSKGFLCPKGSVLHHLNDDPDRLRSPMIKQDDGSHREVTWDEAFAEVERLMVPLREAHGPDSTAVYVGNPNVHGSSIFSLQALVMALATTNLYTASSVDQLPKEIANGLLYGDPPRGACPTSTAPTCWWSSVPIRWSRAGAWRPLPTGPAASHRYVSGAGTCW